MDKVNRKIITFLLLSTLWSFLTISFVSYLENMGVALWINLATIILVYGLPIFIIFIAIKNTHFTNRQITGLFLILLALPIFGYALFGIQIPTIQSTRNYEDFETITNALGQNTTVQFDTVMYFSAVGSFSADNPIHVKVTVFDTNVTDFTNYFSIVAFTGSNPITSGNIGELVSGTGHLNLTQTGNGEYQAEGNLIWYQDIDTHSAWLAPNTTYFNEGYWQTIGQAKLNISPAADTLAFQSNHIIEQLTYVLVGFSVIMLQPIFEALFHNKEIKPIESQTSQTQYSKHTTQH